MKSTIRKSASLIVLALGFSLGGTVLAQSNTCGAIARVQSQDLSIAPELDSPSGYTLGGASGVLARSYSASLTVDNLITRLKISNCLALAESASTRISSAAVDAAGYKPKTEFDNTPWRFDMTQNGKRMTADEFDAWMKAKGVRVATGAVAPAPASVAPGTTPSQGSTVPARPGH